jgi:hypothetical protein
MAYFIPGIVIPVDLASVGKTIAAIPDENGTELRGLSYSQRE